MSATVVAAIYRMDLDIEDENASVRVPKHVARAGGRWL